EYLYNGKYGVSTDRNGLYYMRARYYDQDIKRFINRDVVSGDITNSQSLNRYCYVQGNPVSLTDPFGLCPTAEEIAKIEFRRKVHVALDIIGIFFDGADVINALLYMAEGDDINAALSVVFLLPGVGSLAGLPIKYAMKLGGNIGESVLKLGKKFAPELVENGSRFIRNIGGKIDDAGRWINRKIGKLFGEGGRGTVENITEPVAAGPSLVQQGEGYNLKEAATKISPVEGYTDVVIHGTSDSFGVWHNGKWEYINQRSLATFLKNNPEYNGGAVRLISCSTGAKPDGIAQQLANKLGVDVLAPSDTLYIYQNGSTVIGPNPYTNTGDWKLFMPGKY
ncbi:MAG: RHS repeat-associated core domain-containing protein, partial [Lachnospiraceae bacterium]|nr:RHS repeat-associated core domain-containing protein [Lachnospiraceae bacterium]